MTNGDKKNDRKGKKKLSASAITKFVPRRHEPAHSQTFVVQHLALFIRAWYSEATIAVAFLLFLSETICFLQWYQDSPKNNKETIAQKILWKSKSRERRLISISISISRDKVFWDPSTPQRRTCVPQRSFPFQYICFTIKENQLAKDSGPRQKRKKIRQTWRDFL